MIPLCKAEWREQAYMAARLAQMNRGEEIMDALGLAQYSCFGDVIYYKGGIFPIRFNVEISEKILDELGQSASRIRDRVQDAKRSAEESSDTK